MTDARHHPERPACMCWRCAGARASRAWDLGLRLRIIHELHGVDNLVIGNCTDIVGLATAGGKGQDR